MIKKLLLSVFLLSNTVLFSQIFNAMYHFTGVQTGSASTGTIDPTYPPTASGITFGAFSAIGFTSAPQANGVFAFKDWGSGATNGDNVNFTGAIDPAKYYEVSLTPAANSTVTLNSISFNMSRSSTGPRHWAIRSSLDSYSVNLSASVVPANANVNVQSGDKFFWALDSYTVPSGKQEKGCIITLGSNFETLMNPITFRFYAFDAESNIGTFRIDTVVFNGLNQLLTGLNKVSYDLNSSFNLYPNPSNDGVVFIKSKNRTQTTFEVFDAIGKFILSAQKENSTEEIKLNLSELPSGTYYLRSVADGKVYNEKLIIMR